MSAATHAEARVRFASSPTGRVHVGNLRTAVFNYLFARHNNGKLLLRVEDTDRDRSTPEAEERLFEALRLMKIDWDEEGEEGFYRQSRHHDRHMEVAEKWLKKGIAYRSDRSTGQFGGGSSGGSCVASGEAIWLRAEPEDLQYDDLILGKQTQPAKQVQDFVIVRSNGKPVFIFANAVDDADMRVTHVLRGADHSTNTFRQLLIYRALGVEPPRFGHLPLIVDKQGKKLSKREGDPESLIYLDEFRERGYLPEALFNFLALLGWSPEPHLGDGGEMIFREKLPRDELIAEFDLGRVGKAPAQFDTVKLGAMNYDYIVDRLKNDSASLIAHLKQDVSDEGLDPDRFDDAQYGVLIREAAQRARTLKELIEKSRFFFLDRVDVNAGYKTVSKAFVNEAVWSRLDATIARLQGITQSEWKRDRLEAAIKGLAEELAGGKMGDIAQPVRILTTGGPASPAIDVTLELLGRERTLERLRDKENRRRLKG
ncbi:MAG: glutamate--tRNA ligase family protein [Acidobacteria bacterium]|nr:glutamate--tRNA ligase family protein [Acidobacteriota bacterium]